MRATLPAVMKTLALSTLLLIAVAGCGSKGPLYLPQPVNPALEHGSNAAPGSGNAAPGNSNAAPGNSSAAPGNGNAVPGASSPGAAPNSVPQK